MKRLAGLALALISLVNWVGVQTPGFVSTAAQVGSSSKEAMWNRLIELDSNIKGIRGQLAANPNDKNLAAQLAAARSEYDGISAALGGDQAPRQSSGNQARPILGPKVLAAPPPGCVAGAPGTGSANPNAAIPDNNPVGITSTIVIAGAGTYLFDVDLTTNITHTFPGDLNITLTSPAGTTLTISTDNGGGNDDAFNGTLWDDSAGATNPPGPANDNTYTNGVVETPLAPEEALSALGSQNPNGTWTLFIADDAAADTGTLVSWSLNIGTLAAGPTLAPPIVGSNNTPTAIPDNDPAGITQTISITGTGLICVVNLTTNITHTFPDDLDIFLTSPAGTTVTISTANGGSNDDVFNGTQWRDDAGFLNPPGPVSDATYVNGVTEPFLNPEEPMAAFGNEDPNGLWTLAVSDVVGADTGMLNSWSLSISTCSCVANCTITCPVNQTVSNDPNQCGAVVNYPAPTTGGTCATVTCSPASGSFFPVGTTTVTCTTTGPPPQTCTFTVTVTDTQPPTIMCPPNQAVVTDQNVCPAPPCQPVNFPPPTASDNCPGVTVVCIPAGGSCFPVGVTSVTCTATDASGNTATCSFTVTTFDTALQDDSNPGTILLWNSNTGAYRFCCNGITFTGVGKASRQGCVYTLQHTPADRRVLGRVDKAVHAGSGSIQAPPGTTRCTITDRNTLNDTLLTACQ